MGQPHPYGTRLCDYQKCMRTNDLDEVGDVTHHTFFEMLGNWSLGDYFKKESISWSFELLTKVLNIPVERLAVTVFKGNDIEKDGYSNHRKNNISLVFQNYNLIDYLTPIENVRLVNKNASETILFDFYQALIQIVIKN